MRLSDAVLPQLAPGISVPRYDRSAPIAGILHVGVGNFHRAHQAVYIDDLLGDCGARGWGILGAGVMPADARMRRGLEEQGWLYTVVEQDADGDSLRVIGSMAGFLPIEEGNAPIVEAMRNPAIRIVSMTVTEGGYFLDPATGAFDEAHPDIQADIASPEYPRTVFGAIVAGLRARRAEGADPFTVMSCDNVPHNGDAAKAAVAGIAARQDRDLGRWIVEQGAFPNSMVDRITPATTEERRRHLAERYGLDDARPVFCEPFRQWVLEDRFAAGRPELERAGVQLVRDVTPYEYMKIRILNGGHAVIAYPAGLLGLEYAHEAMAHPLIAGFLETVEREEIIPVTPPVPATSLDDYAARVCQRFSNPRIADTVRRLCFDGPNRQPKFIIPSIRDNLSRGGPIRGLALTTALWCRYCFGVDEKGAEIQPNDPNWDRLRARAEQARRGPDCWLAMREVYGDMGGNDRFREAFSSALSSLWEDGTEAALRAYLTRPA